jgi:hypothetical protein
MALASSYGHNMVMVGIVVHKGPNYDGLLSNLHIYHPGQWVQTSFLARHLARWCKHWRFAPDLVTTVPKRR